MLRRMHLPKNRPKPKFTNRYPWDKWFLTAGVVKITQGQDYHFSTYSMMQMIRYEARDRGRRIRQRRWSEGEESGILLTVYDSAPKSSVPRLGGKKPKTKTLRKALNRRKK